MKELLQGLGDIINSKKTSELREINKDFLELLENKVAGVEAGSTGLLTENYKPTTFVDYVHSDMKRRAQTVATAYRIGLQLLLAHDLGRPDLVSEVLNGLSYFGNPHYLNDIWGKTPHVIGAHDKALISIGSLALEDVSSLTRGEVIDVIANSSITFAWVETFYKTTFMPKDIEILDTSHEVHLKLVDEIKALLNNSGDFIRLVEDVSNKGKNLFIGGKVISSNYGIEGTAGIIAGNRLFEVKTTGSKPTLGSFRKDATHAVGVRLLEQNPLDTNAPQFDIIDSYIYYPRFNEIVRVVESEQE